MNQLLKLALYIMAATGLAWLVLWGCDQIGLPDLPSVVLAGIVFVLVLIFGFNRTGTADL